MKKLTLILIAFAMIIVIALGALSVYAVLTFEEPTSIATGSIKQISAGASASAKTSASQNIGGCENIKASQLERNYGNVVYVGADYSCEGKESLVRYNYDNAEIIQ